MTFFNPLIPGSCRGWDLLTKLVAESFEKRRGLAVLLLFSMISVTNFVKRFKPINGPGNSIWPWHVISRFRFRFLDIYFLTAQNWDFFIIGQKKLWPIRLLFSVLSVEIHSKNLSQHSNLDIKIKIGRWHAKIKIKKLRTVEITFLKIRSNEKYHLKLNYL